MKNKLLLSFIATLSLMTVYGQQTFISQNKDFPSKLILQNNGYYSLIDTSSSGKIYSEGSWKMKNDSLMLKSFNLSLLKIDSLSHVEMIKSDSVGIHLKFFTYRTSFENTDKSNRDKLNRFPIGIELFGENKTIKGVFDNVGEFHTLEMTSVDSIKIIDFFGLPEWWIYPRNNENIYEIGFQFGTFFKMMMNYSSLFQLGEHTWIYSENKIIFKPKSDIQIGRRIIHIDETEFIREK